MCEGITEELRMESLACRERIRKLLAKMLRDQGPERFAAIVNREQFPPRAPLSFVLGERLSKTYWHALNEATRELVPHHVAQSDLDQALWRLFGEVAADAEGYRAPGALKRRLDKFAQDLKKPLHLFEVAYAIENLNLGSDRFLLEPVRFLTPDEDELGRWGLSRSDPILSHCYADFAGHSLAIVHVHAAKAERAFETGLKDVLVCLDLLRVAGVRGLLSRLMDEMFLWSLTGHWIARQIEPEEKRANFGWHRTFRPLIVDMGAHISKGLSSEFSGLLVIANGELPDEISGHLKRATTWISYSVARERLDDKIVDLCTALEILLLPAYRQGRKGEMIALRQRLLGSDWNPADVLALYELRSKIVHGSALNVCNYLDYWNLLLICFNVLQNLVRFAKDNPEIYTAEDLVTALETEENLKGVIRLFDGSIFRGHGARQVKSMTKRRLREVQSSV